MENIQPKQKIKKTENLKEYMKNYKATHKEEVKQYNKKYFEKNNPNEKFSCDCGGSYSKANKSVHKLTMKHLKYLVKVNNNDNENIII
jgi:hypothetical protein